MMRRLLLLMGSVALMSSNLAAAADASQDVRQSPYYRGYDFYAGAADAGTYGDGEIHPWHVQGNIWLLSGEPDESNVAVQIGNDGALVVDTGSADMAPKLVAAINKLAAEHGGDQTAIQWVVNTDGLADHISGNLIVRNAGNTVVGGNFARDNPGLTSGATVVGSLNMLTRMVAPNAQGQPSVAQGLWPNETHTEDLFRWDFNDEAVELRHPQSANTDGNMTVLFRHSDVLATGDVLSMTSYPIIDVERGGSIDGELGALNDAIRLAVADHHNGSLEGGTMIIPGHGRLCDQADLIEYTIIITTIRNRVMFYKNRGKTLEQVLALKPTWDFDQRWAAKSGLATPDAFVRAIYETLPLKGKGPDRFAMSVPWTG